MKRETKQRLIAWLWKAGEVLFYSMLIGLMLWAFVV